MTELFSIKISAIIKIKVDLCVLEGISLTPTLLFLSDKLYMKTNLPAKLANITFQIAPEVVQLAGAVTITFLNNHKNL